MLVDSHCHLDRLKLSDREGGLEAVIADAQARGVSNLLTVAVDLESSKSLTEITAKYNHIYSIGGSLLDCKKRFDRKCRHVLRGTILVHKSFSFLIEFATLFDTMSKTFILFRGKNVQKFS